MASPMSMTSNKDEGDWAEGAAASYDFVRFTMSDIHGISRSKLVPRSHVDETLKTGITMCTVINGIGTRSEMTHHSELDGLNFSNCIVRPMPDTLHALPWATGGKFCIGEVLCETLWMPPYHDGRPQAACTRYLARTQLDRLSALGYQFLSGYEAEFYMYRKNGEGDVTSRPMFHGVDIFCNVIHAEHEELMCCLPSSAANPYIVLAATVAAGIDGLVNCLELPVDHGETLPWSLSEALSALESDKVLREALGEEFIRWFLSLKRQVEIKKINEANETGREEIDVERELYFKFL